MLPDVVVTDEQECVQPDPPFHQDFALYLDGQGRMAALIGNECGHSLADEVGSEKPLFVLALPVVFAIDTVESVTVNIDETRGDHFPFDVDHGIGFGLAFQPADSGDPSVLNRHIGIEAGIARSVHDLAVDEQDVECFCFNQQELKAGEEKIMPLQFVLDDGLPEEITTVTLSYTFMDINRDKLQKNIDNAQKELKNLI